MKYGVLVQPSAKAEMREAYRWYYNQSPAAARRWLDKLLKTIDTLRTQPERCALARRSQSRRPGALEVSPGEHPLPNRWRYLLPTDLTFSGSDRLRGEATVRVYARTRQSRGRRGKKRCLLGAIQSRLGPRLGRRGEVWYSVAGEVEDRHFYSSGACESR